MAGPALDHGCPERLLQRFAATGDPGDLEALVVRYRPLARSLARRYLRADTPLEDLEQVACMGLIKAIRRFDPQRGCAFTTFAVPTILGELRRFRRETAWALHVPRPIQERVGAVRQAAEELGAAQGRAATVFELAHAVGCTEEQVTEALDAGTTLNAISLDGCPDEDGEETRLRDALSVDDPGYELVEALACIERALPTLTPREREVVRLRFAEELSHVEIGRRLAISPSRAARLLSAALERFIGPPSRPPGQYGQERQDRHVPANPSYATAVPSP